MSITKIKNLKFDVGNFIITPLTTGFIEGKIRIFHNDVEIDIINTPAKVVKQTSVKISTAFAIMVPVISGLFDTQFSDLLISLIPFYSMIGGFEGTIAIITGTLALFSGFFYYLKKPKDAEPIHSDAFSLEDYIDTNLVELLYK